MGKDTEVPCDVRKMQDGRSQGDASGRDSLPESPSQNWDRHNEKQRLCVLPNLAWTGKKLFGSIFCLYFLAKSSLNT